MEKSVEEKFLEQERKLGLLSKGLIDVIWVVNAETMRYTYISPSVETIRGFTVEEAMSLPLKNHLAGESYDIAVTAIMDGLREFETNPDVKRTVEVEMLRKDGGSVWVDLTARLAKEKDGTVKIVGVTRDVSQRKLFEMEKEKLIAQLTEALEEQKRLHKEIRVLHGLLPICADCKKIRDEDGKWWRLEEFITAKSEAEFTHTICPDCKEKTLALIREMARPRVE